MTLTDQSLELHCPHCGYDLRHIESAFCPECGNGIDRSTLGQSTLPWLHRRQIGRYRAFWRTVQLVAVHPRSLGREMSCPAQLPDAVTFRKVAVLHVLLPFGLALSFTWASAIGKLWVPTDVLGSVFQILSLVVGWFCLATFLWGMSGAAGYFFHPASLSIIRQNRAIALSYYACAPVAYLPLTTFLAVPTLAILAGDARAVNVVVKAIIALIGVGPLVINLGFLIRSPFVLLRVILQSERHFVLAASLPVIWLLWGVATLVLLPAIWVALVIMILSLHG